MGRIGTLWRRKAVRFPLYTVLTVGAMYATFSLVWQPPKDDGPLPRLGGMTAVSRIEPLFSSVASRLADRPVEVRCWSEKDWRERTKEVSDWTDGRVRLGPWSGYVSHDHDRANLPPTICSALGRWAYEERWPDDRREAYYFAWAVEALAHEVQHLRGIDDESKAECYGLQSIRELAAGLGIDEEGAEFLVDYAWFYFYPRAPAQYRSDECRDGGELDLRPEVTVWP